MQPELHPAEDQLRLHLLEQLPSEESAEIESHLEQCADCLRQLEMMAADDAFWNAIPEHFPSPVKPTGGSAVVDQEDATTRAEEFWFVEQDQIRELLSPTDDPTKLGRLGHYEVVGIVGAGATAVVLKAFDGPLNRYVAIKLLRPTLATSANARKRFSREARAAASIVHENVIEIHGVSEDERLPYLVMPYIPGESLAMRIERAWPLSTEAILHIACQVADGLAAAHAKSLIHRDVKPSNILLGQGIERLKLTDFGLARAVDEVGLTRTGILAGTPEYMSPEQASGKSVDHRSDLFSLGGVLYAMCTGRPPFASDSCYGVLRRIVEEQPASISQHNPEVPAWLVRLVQQLMDKDLDRRPKSAAAVAETLRQCLNHLHDPAVPVPTELQPPRGVSAGRVIVLSLVAAVILIGSAIGVTKAVPEKTIAPRQPANSQSTQPISDEEIRWDDGVDRSLQELSNELQRLGESL